MPTILITGSSSGFGLETARRFHAQGWTVVATMRSPQAAVLPVSDRIRTLALDVTDPASIAAAVAAAGPLDVLVNNAGVGLFGALEATPMDRIREVFATNTFGTMAMCQAVIPQFRARGAGTIVNVTSSAVFRPYPLVAPYTASKTAIEGFTGALALELAQFGIRTRLVEPGYSPDTAFSANTAPRMAGLIPEAYGDFARRAFAGVGGDGVTHPEDVADAVWRAVNDRTDRLRFPAGADSVALAATA